MASISSPATYHRWVEGMKFAVWAGGFAHGTFTLHDVSRHFNISKEHASQLVDAYCEALSMPRKALLREGSDKFASTLENAILERIGDGNATHAEILEDVDVRSNTLRATLSRMTADGLITKTGRKRRHRESQRQFEYVRPKEKERHG